MVLLNLSLLDLNTGCEVITSTSFNMLARKVVVLAFSELDPVRDLRVRAVWSPIVSPVSPSSVGQEQGHILGLIRGGANREVTVIIADHVESVSCGLWWDKPRLEVATMVVCLVDNSLDLEG